MITQQHENEIQQKAQAPAPVKEHRWIVVLFSILGVALPLVAGWESQWPLIVLPFPTNDWTFPIVFLVVVPVAVGAFLLCFAFRAWWVALFAGVAWYVGEVLGAVVRTIVEGSSSQLLAWDPFWSIHIGLILSLAVVPLIIGMVLGAAGALTLVELGKRSASRQ